jgi:hypothetical protein
MNRVVRLPIALCVFLAFTACEDDGDVGRGDDPSGGEEPCQVPAGEESPVQITVVQDSTAAAGQVIQVDKDPVTACVGDQMEWFADTSEIESWSLIWSDSSPLVDGASPTSDERGRGGGEALIVGTFKYSLDVILADSASTSLVLDPDAVILPGR